MRAGLRRTRGRRTLARRAGGVLALLVLLCALVATCPRRSRSRRSSSTTTRTASRSPRCATRRVLRRPRRQPAGRDRTGRRRRHAAACRCAPRRPGTNPELVGVRAHRTPTDKSLERWLTADRYTIVGSGTVWPDLDARRIEARHAVGRLSCPSASRATAPTCSASRWSRGRRSPTSPSSPSRPFRAHLSLEADRLRAQEPRPPAVQRHHAGPDRPARHLPDRDLRGQPQGDLPRAPRSSPGACSPTCASTSASSTSCSNSGPRITPSIGRRAKPRWRRASSSSCQTFLRLGALARPRPHADRRVDDRAARRSSPLPSSIRGWPRRSRALSFLAIGAVGGGVHAVPRAARPGPRAFADADVDAVPGLDLRDRR